MTSIQALVGFAAWTLVLVVLVFAWRGIELLRGRKADSWTRGAAIDSPGLVKRIEHAHLNCLENLPVFAVIVLSAAATGKLALTTPYASCVLYARLCQTVVHLIGVNHWLVMLRAGFWGAQLVLFFYMIYGLLGGHAA
ncbi:MAG: MAPEG family protein [Nevskia sp.]|nr:MAPEG family protein [Nevskia sp.]